MRYTNIFLTDKGIFNSNYSNEKILKKNYPIIYSEFLLYISSNKMLEHLPYRQQLYHFIYELNDIPKCPICGNLMDSAYINPGKGYDTACSKKCRMIISIQKRKQTCKELYGNENPLLNKDIKEKRKETMKLLYGTENFVESEYFKKKRMDSLIERYGENPISSKEIQHKIKETCNERYDTDSVLQSKQFKEQRKRTWVEKYGVDNPMKNKEIKDKNTTIKFENYKNYLKEKYIELDIQDISVNRDVTIRCATCSNVYTINSFLLHQRMTVYHSVPCLFCNPINSTRSDSEGERQLCSFIKELLPNAEILENDRTAIAPKELDIYIPEMKIAFEYNGVYWHSEEIVSKDYHMLKKIECKKQGIKLIQIWQDDWETKQNIVKSRVTNALGLSKRKLFARKCKIRKINSKTSKEFMLNNHLMGNANGSIKLGLFYGEELVSVMTFCKPRKNTNSVSKEGHYELLRFANVLETNVMGAAGKLFSFFVKEYNPVQVISYADGDWTEEENDIKSLDILVQF